MKYTTVIKTIFITLLLSGYLTNLRAEDTMEQLNIKAEEEHSPYRWISVENTKNKTAVVKQLHGTVIYSSTLKGPRKTKIISRVTSREKSNGRSTNITLKELRLLPPAGHWGQLQVEAWIFDNEGEEVVYTIWYRTPGDYTLNGPWTKSPNT
jgi:hypothetical protein